MDLNSANLNGSDFPPLGRTLPDAMIGSLANTHRSLWLILWQRRFIIIITLAISVLAAVCYLLNAVPVFSSQARIYVQQKGPRVITDENGLMTQSKNYLNTQCELLRSPAILNRVIQSLDLDQMQLGQALNNTTNPASALSSYTKIGVDAQSDIINITALTPWPRESVLLANKIVEAYIEFQNSEKKSEARNILQILNNEKKKLLQQQSQNSLHIVALSRANPTHQITSHRLTTLTDALTQAELKTLQARADYESLNALMDDPERIRELVESHKASGQYKNFDASEPQLYTELAQIQDRLKLLQREGTVNHPSVQAAWDRMAQINRELEAIQNRYAQACRNAAIHRWVSAMRREEQIRSEWQNQQDQMVQADAQTEEYTNLIAERDRIRKSCDLIDSRIKELNLSDDTGGLNIKVLQRAALPKQAVWPSKRKIVSNAVLIGLFIGVLLALTLDWFDHRIRNASEVAELMGISVLGTVPVFGQKNPAGYNENALTRQGTIVFHNPAGRIAEACRSIRASLFYGLGLGTYGSCEQGKTLLVTSADPGDGKSTLVSNLAITLAQTGQKTLIIDADLRKPDQFRIFNVFRNNDLSGVLTGRCELDEAIMIDVLDQVDLLPACAVPEWTGEDLKRPDITTGPAELLSGPVFRTILEQLSARYDCILIDSPPMLHVADALILASLCDYTLFVVRSGKTSRRAVQQGRDGLLSVGAVIAGSVINGVTESRRHNAYSAYYNYYGRSGTSVPISGPVMRPVPADRYDTVESINVDPKRHFGRERRHR